MQEEDGTMRLLAKEEVEKADFQSQFNPLKVIREGMCFRIKYCFFKITRIFPDGIEARGISRKEFYDSKC